MGGGGLDLGWIEGGRWWVWIRGGLRGEVVGLGLGLSEGGGWWVWIWGGVMGGGVI